MIVQRTGHLFINIIGTIILLCLYIDAANAYSYGMLE